MKKGTSKDNRIEKRIYRMFARKIPSLFSHIVPRRKILKLSACKSKWGALLLFKSGVSMVSLFLLYSYKPPRTRFMVLSLL